MGDPRYEGIQHFDGMKEGIVVQNDDPKTRCRVRVIIPNLIEDESSWASPMGTVGGGAADRGFWSVPEIGASVVCWFVEGDPDEIYYCTSNWSQGEDGVSQTPSAVQTAVAEDGYKVAKLLDVFSSKRFEMVFDRREGKGRLYLRSKRHEDNANNGKALMLEFDDETGQIAICAPGGINLNSLGFININSNTGVVIQGRVINPMGGVIP